MNFHRVFSEIVPALESAGARFALIGGMAMAFRGVQRATLDIDLILLLQDLEAADAIFENHGFQRVFRSPNVSQYQSPPPQAGRIDVLHAFRGPTLGMLDRAERLPWRDGCLVPVVHVEDLIGLKIQAFTNDPSRSVTDRADIHLLLCHAGRENQPLDWELIGDYLSLFDLQHELPHFQSIHGQAD